MRLYDEIFKNAEGGALRKCIVVPNGGGYFEGVKSVEDFSPERVVLCFPKDRVAVEGKNLSVRKYCEGDLQLDGRISSLQVLSAETERNV